MPRIFHVRFTREFDATIVAESEAHLQAALENSDPQWWEDASPDWKFQIHDPIKSAKNSEKMPVRFSEAEMGVLNDEVVNICDYKLKHPEYLDAVEKEAREARYKKGVDEVNLRLPEIG